MKKIGFLILLFSITILSSYAQLQIRNIVHDLGSINKSDKFGKQGVWFFFDKIDSTMFAKQTFVNDTLNGSFERYWRNGRISEKGFYKRGKLDSIYIAYWENGEIRGQVSYKNGLLNGIVSSFDPGNKVTSRVRYIDGKIDSSYKDAFLDSSITWDNQAHNKIDTVVTKHNSDWNKDYVIYVNDTLNKEIHFFKNEIAIENFYDKSKLIMRIVYSTTYPYYKKKVFYYNNENLTKTEFYNKKGKLTKSK